MAGDASMVKPTNKIVVDSEGLRSQTVEVQTATDVYPGRLLEKGTDDGQVVVCAGTNPAVGWAGYEQTSKKYRPATVDTIYTVNSYIAMVYGPGMRIVASIASGEAAVKGTLLTKAAHGQLAVATAGTHHVYAIAEETVTGATGGADYGGSDIIVRSLL